MVICLFNLGWNASVVKSFVSWPPSPPSNSPTWLTHLSSGQKYPATFIQKSGMIITKKSGLIKYPLAVEISEGLNISRNTSLRIPTYTDLSFSKFQPHYYGPIDQEIRGGETEDGLSIDCCLNGCSILNLTTSHKKETSGSFAQAVNLNKEGHTCLSFWVWVHVVLHPVDIY